MPSAPPDSHPVSLKPGSATIYTISLLSLAAVTLLVWLGIRDFDKSVFLPHWYCLVGNKPVLWTHIIADGVIGLSYMAISVTLGVLVHRGQRGIPFGWMFLAFGAFIVACGFTHLMEIVTVWTPLYWLSACVKVVTALASLVTAIILPTLVPKSVKLVFEGQLAQERKVTERFYSLLQSCPTPIIATKLDGTVTLWNPAAEHLFGWSAAEVISQFDPSVPESKIGELRRAIEQLSAGASVGPIQTTRLKKNGDSAIVDLSVAATKSDGDGVNGIVAVLTDVTDRTLAEETRRLQASVLEAAANAIVITDRDGQIQWVNPAFERLTGYSGSDVQGENPRILKSGQHSAEVYANLWKTISSGRVWEGNLINRRKDGSTYTEHQTITPVQNSKQDITHFVGIKVDISESVKAQMALETSEAAYRSLVEGAPYGIYRVREHGEIIMANPALARMLGYESPSDLIGLNTARDLYLTREAREESLSRWRGGAETPPYEAKWKRKDGKEIDVRLAGRTLNRHGDEVQAYEVFVENVTERRILEQQFRQAQKMEAVGRLAGGVAHDFNNLLMIISSYAELIPASLEDPTKTRSYTEAIREATTRAVAVTQQLLAFSRKQVMQPSVLDVNKLVGDLSKMLQRLLGEDIEISFLPKAVGKVKVDATQMEQVIINLAVNARDAMPGGGKLVIETADVVLDQEYSQRHGVKLIPGEYVMLAMTDTGIGMDEQTKARVFEPFFTTKERGKGTGLGLATVYGIVKQSEGFVWVYSELNRGTTFRIYLPVTVGAEDRKPTVTPEVSIARGTGTILLVEDEDSLRVVTRNYLESLGYKVIEASNGLAALEVIRSSKIDLLITDMVMPALGGPELAGKATEECPNLRVIFISGYTDRIIDPGLLGSNAAFLQKPFSLSALALKVRDQLLGHLN